MPRNSRQKLKLLYLKDYLLKNTDETHGVTVKNMIEYLESCGVAAERKSVYDDLETLAESGMDILSEKRDRNTWYHVASREFEISELKLLVDAVLGSRFVTERKSAELIRKLESLCSRYEAYALDRQLTVAGRIKAMNESIYYNVDKIHAAIRDNTRISFRYFEYNVQKDKVYRHDGARYEVSPFALCWDNENYYLVAYDAAHEQIRHYRVDKMDGLQELADLRREGEAAFREVDVSAYASKVFSMFGGASQKVRLEFADRLAGVVLDRFGKEVFLVPTENGFVFEAEIVVSPQFYGWLFSFGTDARILSPQSVKDGFAEYLRQTAAQYGETN